MRMIRLERVGQRVRYALALVAFSLGFVAARAATSEVDIRRGAAGIGERKLEV